MTTSLGIRIHNRNLIGMTFGRWTVLDKAPRDKFGFAHWTCLCKCGNIKTVSENTLIRGKSTSCGCITSEINSQRGTHHQTKTRIYRAWRHMRTRCENPKYNGYKNYGGRGITICDRWLCFDNFFQDMSPHPGEGYSLDRIDNDGNYEPSNCRWATRKQQSSNQAERVCEICGKVCNSGSGLAIHKRVTHGQLQNSSI